MESTIVTYRIDRGSGIEGPLAEDAIRALATSGTIDLDTHIQTTGEESWHTLGNHPDFAPVPKEPAPTSTEPRPDDLAGLGGWLVLVGLGLFFSFFRLLASLLEIKETLTPEVWAALTRPESEAYHPLWAPAIIGEVLINGAMLVAAVLLLMWFFGRARYFPRAFISFMVAGLVLGIIDVIAVGYLLGEYDDQSVHSIARGTISCLIWIPYMLRSSRVRNTFVN